MNLGDSQDNDDTGAPLPDFRAHNIQLQTVMPSLSAAPDYLDYDPKGRGIVVTMFANTGMSYLLGTSAGGVYGFQQGLKATPNTRFRVQLNSVLNHCGRYGSRAGNAMGVFAVLYSLFEGVADQVSTVCRCLFVCSDARLVAPTTSRQEAQVSDQLYFFRSWTLKINFKFAPFLRPRRPCLIQHSPPLSRAWPILHRPAPELRVWLELWPFRPWHQPTRPTRFSALPMDLEDFCGCNNICSLTVHTYVNRSKPVSPCSC